MTSGLPMRSNLHQLASAIKLGLTSVPQNLSWRQKRELVRLGVKLELPPKPDNRPWRLK